MPGRLIWTGNGPPKEYNVGDNITDANGNRWRIQYFAADRVHLQPLNPDGTPSGRILRSVHPSVLECIVKDG